MALAGTSLKKLIDCVSKLDRLAPSCFGKIIAFGSKDYATRSIDDHPPTILILTRTHSLYYVASLRAYAGNQDGHVADNFADNAEFFWVSCTDYHHAVTALIPVVCHAVSNVLV